MFNYYSPAAVGKGHYKIDSGVSPSVCVKFVGLLVRKILRIYCVSIKRNKAHQFQNQRPKVEVTTPTNAQRESALYFPNGKAYELQTWYMDGEQEPGKRHDLHGQRSPGRLILRAEMAVAH